jgi:probable F420-dependent oxidoreductase
VSRYGWRAMKVRIGVGTGSTVSSGDELGHLVEDLEKLGFDSVWLSDILTLPGDDPLVGMAYAAGRAERLKIGTTMVLPGRNPVRLAKQLATLDRVSGGRLLVTFVLGLRFDTEIQATGVPVEERGRHVDELLPLVRRLWSEDGVDHDGERWSLRGVTVEPKPLQQPLEVWLCGNVTSALRRVGALADGWLPALCTPEEVESKRRVVEEAAAAAGRRIDPEHFGVSVGYAREELPAEAARRVAERAPGRDVADLVPVGMDGLHRLLERYIDVGFSKFVVRPVVPPRSWRTELEELAEGVLDLQA